MKHENWMNIGNCACLHFLYTKKWDYLSLLAGHTARHYTQFSTMTSFLQAVQAADCFCSTAEPWSCFFVTAISTSLDQVSERNSGKLIGIFHSPFLKAKPLLCRQKDLPMGKIGQSTFASKRTATSGNPYCLLQHAMSINLNKWLQNLPHSASVIDGGRRPFVFFLLLAWGLDKICYFVLAEMGTEHLLQLNHCQTALG